MRTGDGFKPGLFYDGGDLSRLAVAAVFLLAMVVWTGVSACLIFLSLERLGILRAPAQLELADFDMDTSRVGGVVVAWSDTTDLHNREPFVRGLATLLLRVRASASRIRGAS